MAISNRLSNGRIGKGPEKGWCSVDGCDRREHCRAYCYAHYFRWYRNGDPGPAEIKAKNPGALCKLDDCAEPVAGQGMCSMHYTRWLRHGDPRVKNVPAPRFGPDNNLWVGDDAKYFGVHERLRRYRGSAADYTCTCGSAAKQWSYDHADPDDRVSKEGAYSVDLSHYEPKCVPCHKRFDLDRIAGTRHFGGAA